MTAMTARIVLTGLILLLTGGNATADTSDGPTIGGSVYGGGNLADVGGSVTVNMQAGIVTKDVYGGGALANTNNFDTNQYDEVKGLSSTSIVTGLYTKEGDIYKEVTTANQTAQTGTVYYRKGKWVTTLTNNTTTVNLLGGRIHGDAYGGGLGRIGITAVEGVHYTQEEIDAAQAGDPAYGKTTNDWKVAPVTGVEAKEATVYGDINVYLGGDKDGAAASATAFTIGTYDGTHSGVVKSGRVFGCNNLNGSPQGDVTVTVYKTVKGSHDKTPAGADEKAPKTVSSATSYRVAAVYGGGNLANYEPTATGKKSHVIIYGCSETSIEYVYGGGNAAAVPETDVDIYEAYEIGTVFGGGNGKDPYTLNGGTNWTANPGANVNGNANTMLYGGLIHEAFGGSNEKGRITGNVAINTDPQGTCTLDVGTIYGAGKNADIDGDLIVTLGCMPADKKTDAVYGGAENANVKGNVELTITSGNFGKVFGGNNQSGAIFGSITLNIMESGCSPIVIDELYLGGNQAAYSVYGYYKAIRYENGGNYYLDASHETPLYVDGSNLYLDENKEKRLYPQNETVGTETITYLYLDEECTKPFYMPRTSKDDSNVAVFFGLPSTDEDHTKPNTTTGQYADPVLNIVSATKIGKVFGGGLGLGAALYGNPTVNINQAYPLEWAGYSEGVTTYQKKDETFGAIGGGYKDENNQDVEGGIFGGGNEAAVYGNTTLNIRTKTTVDWKVLVLDNDKKPILDDNGNFRTQTLTGQEYNTVIGANIAGNVYGGGNLADVTGSTEVNICAKEVTSGTTTSWQSVTPGMAGVSIAGNVYGGGKGVARESGARAFFCEEAMVGENDTNSAENNDDPAYADYGTHVRIGNGTIGNGTTGGNVYGGGEIGRVEFHTEVVIGLGAGTGGTTKSPVINGSVFGAGKGTNTHGYSGLVRGDCKVTVQADAKIGQSVYGGGEMASVGKYEVVNGLPKTPLFGGKCTVTIGGYAEIGPDNMQMTKAGGPDDTGHVFGAGKGTLPYENVTGTPWSMQTGGKVTYDESYTPGEDGLGYEAAYYKFIQSLGLASNSDVTIGGNAFVKGSVYGGSENGYLQANTHVTIAGGQIGAGYDKEQNKSLPKYAETAFIDPSITPVTTEKALATCATWTYDKVTTGKPYDKYAAYLKSTDNEYYYDAEFTKSSKGGAPVATDGHTYYGNVFGGGRGVVPFAAGKWHRAAGSVAGNTQVDITAGHILSSVYGGNENTDVGSYALGTDGEPTTTLSSGGTCTINITGGTVGVPRTKEQIEDNPVIGNVFGAGKGDKRVLFNTWTNVGATSVNISGTAIIYGSVFGGGEDGHVIGNAVSNIGGTVTTGIGSNTTDHNYSKVVIGSTGISGADGNVFGGGRGSETALTAGVVGGNVNLTIDNGNILGSVYGGGRLASVGTNFVNPENTSLYGALQTPAADHGNTVVTINGGTIGASDNSSGKLLASDYSNGDVFGGSMGMASNFDLGIARSTTINMTGGTAYGSIYGGGELAQVVESHTTEGKAWGTEITISGGTIGVEKDKLPVNISSYGAKYGNVYGGGKGNTANVEAGLIKTNTKISISQAESKTTTIYHNIYGGGAYGSVGTITYGDATYVPNQTAAVSNMPTAWERAAEGTTQVNTGTAEVYVYGGTIGTNGNENGMVFGSSRGDVGTPDDGIDPNNCLAWVYNTKVEIGGEGKSPIIKGSVYGSGENGHVFTDTQVDIHNGTIGVTADDSFGGPNYRLRGNVYGGGCGEDTYPDTEGTTYEDFNPLAGIVLGTTNVTIDGGQVVHNVYGAGALGSATNTSVTIEGDAVIGVSGKDGGNVFGAARGKEGITIVGSNLANSIETAVNVNGGQIWGSVYGGGETGNVKQDVSVSMTGGVVAKDVYGGGALAHTQTANWDTTNDTWATGKIGTDGKTVYKTTVNLLGGEIHGDAYGGGLGQKDDFNGKSGDIAAQVYGDVNVNLGSESGSSATAFNTSHYADANSTADYDESTVIKSGRVFGCNNLNGSPKGNVTVRVWRTVEGKLDGVTNPRTPKDDDTGCADKTSGTHSYDVAAVYGGGNLADYEAKGTGKKAHVVIETCDVSIETVYGGGNAAEVPGTDVLVKGAYEINEVFGGGNGSDPYTTDGGTTWVDNPGANIGNALQGGNASTLMTGGLIHAAYGGSNKKGTIFGSVSIDIGEGDEDHCDLDLEKMVGAGKDADVNGDLIMVLGCKPNTKIPVVYGGADNAHVNGDIELTITSGIYEEVYGGNNAGGYVFGHIKLNIEERDCTTPIKIDHLYLGGKQAAYSMYGYYNAGIADAPDPQPRTAAMADPTDATHYKEPLTKINGVDVRKQPDATTHSYAKPELNIISCTYIGEVYGGGYGSNATLYGDPIVNINMVPGPKAADNIDRDGNGTADGLAHALGKIGDVYGGGNQAAVEGSTTVNIGTAKKVEMTSLPKVRAVEGDPEYDANLTADEQPMVYQKETVEGAYITGDVYGGGNEANVTGNTYVNVCAYKDDDNTTVAYKGVTISGTDFEGVRIKGNVFGGGKGVTEDAGVTGAFLCAKAMVGEVNTNDGSTYIMNESTDKGTRVSIGNGTVEGSVYGGGEVGRVEWNGVVTIGLPVGAGETSAPVIQQNVFGGGKGVEQYGYAALLRGNTFVTVQANAKVGKSVYGGGEIASVGKYNIVKQTDIDNPTFMEAHPGIEKGMPYSLGNEGSGYCNVIVRGNAEIGPDNMKMYYADGTPPDDEGHVFGAGKGVLPYENEDDFECQASDHNKAKHPGRMGPDDAWECYYGQEAKYLKFIETQALATHTEVLVDGNAFVKGSVYGGSLSGHVQHDTHVTIAGDCQIGAGFDELTGKSLAKYTNWPTNTQDITTSWAECAHWTYDAADNSSYDPYAKYLNDGEGGDGKYYYDEDHTKYAAGGSHIAKDGHTYYGNVFGGGSGIVPYKPGEWHRESGTVGGNTVVDIIGGHILTSVYGGNEHTDVGTYDNTNYRNLLAGTGKCIINMTGGTVGVPRTKVDIAAHPVTCYVFGGGKGDARVTFNKWTNVGETEVNITGSARIYGSTFGGGEDGHVLGNVVTNIGGSVDLNGDGDKTDAGETFTDPSLIIGTHGLSGADGNIFGGGRGFSEEALTAGVVCGNVTVNIYKGTMLGSVFGGGRLASVGTHLDSEGGKYYGKLIPEGKNQVIGSDDVEAPGVTHGHITINISGGTIGATDAQGKLLTSTSSIGDVFGGCKGSGNNKQFGLAKMTTITMTGGTVNGNVYGGGELGYVGEATLNTTSNVYEWSKSEEENASGGLCTVGISGGTVAGNVFGAGKGKADDFDCEKALVRTTSVAISGTGTRVSGNVYGGGEIGRVDQNTEVTIGNESGTQGGAAAPTITGNVFGAGAGVETHGYSALVRGHATVTIQGNASVGQSVYGGGMIASVGQYGLDENFMPEALKSGGDCKVTVKGYAVIGASGEGHVFGAGMGINPFDDDHKYIDYTTDPTDKETKPKRMTKKPAADKMPALYDNVGDGSMYIWEYYTSQDKYFNFLQTLALATDSYATVEGNATVKGSVYGGSESGFVQRETDVKIQGSSKIETTTDTNGKAINGNVFGGGRGVSGFNMAGRVRGNAKTTISGSSTVYGTVYGGGELGFVGKFEKSTDDYGTIYNWSTIKNQANVDENTGLCTVEINSATAEVKGHVFGAGKGEAETFECEPAMTKTTSVTISAGKVGGNVYGGGEVGRVDKNTEVTIGDGTSDGAGSETGTDAPVIAGSVFGAGAGLETHGYSALVRGNATVTIQGNANVGQSVYGGGQIASVGRYALDKFQMPSLLVSGGICTVDVKGWSEIGTSTQGGNVFGACRGVDPDYNYGSGDKKDWSKRMMKYSEGFVSGKIVGTDWDYYDNDHTYIWDYMTSESAYLSYLETLALATEPIVTISGNTNIYGDVYGGGERGLTKGSVTVNIQGGTIKNDVYGGGALANTNISNWTKYGGDTPDNDSDDLWNWTDASLKSAKYTTTVNLHGGTIGHNVYGGGLGEKPSSTNANGVAALVYGDVLVNLNETITSDNCVVKGVVHGANNYNGSPLGDVTVHVYKTQGWTDTKGTPATDDDVSHDVTTQKATNAPRTDTTYELKAVYGGGNEAAYDTESYYEFTDPDNAERKAHVIIDGCDLTSIKTVYGGGNAAAAPATHVEVNSCYEIGKVFAGGNGKDALDDGTPNFGAHIGYRAANYSYDSSKTDEENLAAAAAAFEAQKANLEYGTGEALAELWGGTIHSAFGGSNTLGNVRTSGTVTLDEADPDDCPLCIEEVYGAGNEADQDGTSNINLGCLSYLREMYGGAKNADINNDIELNIQSGRFDRVFGGNNLGGDINGSITVNIEETGCHPIIIGQLFGGGNQAAYTVPSGKHGPTVNVKSFTSIGEIYGGGYGESAVIHGDTYVNINEYIGDNATMEISETEAHTGWSHFDVDIYDPATGDRVETKTITLEQPTHDSGAIGSIGNVFGGGNEADVDGNTNVRIGNMSYVPIASVVAGTTDVRGYYILRDAGTEQSPFVLVSDLPVSPVSGVTYYVKENENYNEVTITAEVTDVRDYYTRSGEGTEQSPYVYTLVSNLPVLAEGSTKYYKPVLGANITGNVYGGGNAADVTGDTNVVIGREVDATP